MDNFLASELYRLAPKPSKRYETPKNFKRDFSAIFNLKEFFIHKASCCARCCKRSRSAAGLELARESLAQELDIVNMLRYMRFAKAAIETLIPESQREKLFEEAQKIEVNPKADQTRQADVTQDPCIELGARSYAANELQFDQIGACQRDSRVQQVRRDSNIEDTVVDFSDRD